jgi:RNA polymerase sigma factor (sigma-70 family)
LTDLEIVNGIKSGGVAENKAIALLYEQNKGEINGFLEKWRHQESAKEPNDIIWEGLEPLVNNIKNGKYQIQQGIYLKTYLKSILKNLWFKHLSSEKARMGRQHAYYEGNEGIEMDVSEILAEKEIWDGYLAIFEKVGKNCKRILQMVYGLGYGIKELAQELIDEGLYGNEQVVRNAKSKCLKKVSEQLTSN